MIESQTWRNIKTSNICLSFAQQFWL